MSKKKVTKTVMLIVTKQCNLNCTYCFEHHKTNESMSVDTAKTIIQNEISDSEQKGQDLIISFFGGEPLLNFSLIKEIVEWSTTLIHKIRVRFFVTSNGTLLTEEVQEWFKAHAHIIAIGLSYDCCEEMQATNRGCTIESVLSFAKKTWPKQEFKFTVSKESLPCLAKGVLDAIKKGWWLQATFAEGLDWTIQDAKVLLTQLRILKSHYLANPDDPLILLERHFKGGEFATRNQVRSCGVGIKTCCYDVDGRCYPCHMFTPITADKRAMLLDDFNRQFEGHELDKFADSKCINCPIKRWCSTCHGFNYFKRGDCSIRNSKSCPLFLVQALVTVEYQLEMMSKEANTQNEIKLIKYLLELYDLLQDRCRALGIF